MTESPTRCPAVGALVKGGVEVAAFRCNRDAGHAEGPFPRVIEQHTNGEPHRVLLEPTLHRYVLEWADAEIELMPSMDLFDPDESIDVAVPIEPPCAWPIPGETCRCELTRGHDGMHRCEHAR